MFGATPGRYQAAWKDSRLPRTSSPFPRCKSEYHQQFLYGRCFPHFSRRHFLGTNVAAYSHRGFHPALEINEGVTHDGARGAFIDTMSPEVDYLDSNGQTSRSKLELSLRYCYEEVVDVRMGDEMITVPIIQYVFRTDKALTTSEIVEFHHRGVIPARYSFDYSNGDRDYVSEPYNPDSFRKMLRRFQVIKYARINNQIDDVVPGRARSYNRAQELRKVDFAIMDRGSS